MPRPVNTPVWWSTIPSRRSSVSTINLLDIYDVERPAGPEHIFIMSMDRTGESEGQYSKISKMYLPYVSGATIYLKQGDSDQMVPTHDGWGEYRTALSFYDAFASATAVTTG